MTTEYISKKWIQVYEAIPDDGLPIRFKEIVKKHPKLSRSTISAALEYFCFVGMVKRVQKGSKKTVEYSIAYPNIKPESKDEIEFSDDFHQLTQPLPPNEQFLLRGKLFASHIVLVHKKIEQCLSNAIEEYTKEPDKVKALSVFNTTIQLLILPLCRQLPYAADMLKMDAGFVAKVRDWQEKEDMKEKAKEP